MWRVEALMAFPKEVTSDLSLGPPEQLELGSRLVPQTVNLQGIELELRKYHGWLADSQDWGFCEPVSLMFRLPAATVEMATETVLPWLDAVLDDLSFQLQEPLRAVQVEILDVTPPLVVGHERQTVLYPFPNGYDQLKLSRSTSLGVVSTVAKPALRNSYSTLPSRVQDALDWFIKAMHSPFDADRFVFYWIAFEILCSQSGRKVEAPTRLRCGHEISECPQCQKQTSMFRQRETTIAFLAELGVSVDVAERLWTMRQMVHGARSFASREIDQLGELLQVLRAASLLALKRANGQADTDPPLVDIGVPIIGSMFLGCRRALREEDLI